MTRHPLRLLTTAAAVTALLVACGDDDGAGVREIGSESGSDSASGSGSASGSAPGSGSASGSASAPADTQSGDGYDTVSDVSSHAAIGADIAAIKALLDVAKEGEPIDWPAVEALFEEGGASVKGDGSVRTLATLVDAPDDVAAVRDAIEGDGGEEDAIRAQRVDKGISVLLARKVIDELAAANDKLVDGDIDPASGAPHNVDEAWAFYTADGNGLAATAEKRAADFDKEGEVNEAVIAALADAQAASVAGDEAAFAAAAEETEHAVDYIFYLATHKYLDTEDDPVRRAEGESFYRGIADKIEAADADAHERITSAFASGDAADGREALNTDAVRAALGVEDDEAVR